MSMTPDEAYAEIGRIAKEHALILHAHGGLMVILTHAEQKRTGHYALCQYMAEKGPHPDSTQGENE